MSEKMLRFPWEFSWTFETTRWVPTGYNSIYQTESKVCWLKFEVIFIILSHHMRSWHLLSQEDSLEESEGLPTWISLLTNIDLTFNININAEPLDFPGFPIDSNQAGHIQLPPTWVPNVGQLLVMLLWILFLLRRFPRKSQPQWVAKKWKNDEKW